MTTTVWFFYLRMYLDGAEIDIDIPFSDITQAHAAAEYLVRIFPEMSFDVFSTSEIRPVQVRLSKLDRGDGRASETLADDGRGRTR